MTFVYLLIFFLSFAYDEKRYGEKINKVEVQCRYVYISERFLGGEFLYLSGHNEPNTQMHPSFSAIYRLKTPTAIYTFIYVYICTSQLLKPLRIKRRKNLKNLCII